MSDEKGNGFFSPQGEGDKPGDLSESPETPSVPQEEGGEEVQPQFVTEDILNQRLQEFERKVQSSRDSALSTFDKRVKQKIQQVESDIEAWRKQGVKISADQEQQRRLNAIQEALSESPDDTGSLSDQSVPARTERSPEDIADEVNAWATQFSKGYGIELAQGDPELMLLDQSSPEAFKQSFRSALYQKRVRTGEAASSSPQARIPSMAQGGKPPTKKEQKFLDEYKAAQGQGLRYAREIRQKWAKEGVNVNALISENF